MTTKNNIPTGYKDSAVGIIPQEWKVKRLAELCQNTGDYGINAPAVPYREDLPTYLRITDIDSWGKFIKTDKASVDNPNSSQFILREGDIVFARTGATVGKTYLYDSKDGQLVFAGFLIRFTPNSNKAVPYYIKACTETASYWNWVRVISQRSGQPGINSVEYGAMKLAVPLMEEQRKIAEILGVWDEAIEKQSRLIEKLELRKRALMQRLLTGRTRLPGFTAPWQKCLYSDILKEVKRTMTWDDNEEYDLISVKRRSGGLFHRDRLLGKDIKTKNLRPAKCGDFLISKMQIVHGASGLVTEEFDEMKISGSYIALVAINGDMVDMKFINWYSKTPYFYHQTYVSSYGVHIEKMTFDLESFMSMNIMLPPFPEQKAIVAVLTTADDEIATHRKKLDALRLQKRGLMQQLLTGKTRVKI